MLSDESKAYCRLSNRLCVVLLVALNLLCFHRTLNGYFLADDFVHVSYLHNVFQGHGERLLLNFTGNWMQAIGTQFYRPLVSLSLAFDYFIGNGNPTVFHISNTIYQIACSLLLFLVLKRLLLPFGKYAQTQAFFAAAFFAVCPLHPEVVSWIIGRVDSLCLGFSLGAFWLYLRFRQDQKKWLLPCALASFAAALMCKEMAVTLPPVFFLAEILLLNDDKTIKAKVIDSIKNTLPFWLLLAAYFILRQLTLGTISGGYGGSIGEGMSDSFFKRWFAEPYFLRVLLPFNAEIFAPEAKLRSYLTALYLASAALFPFSLLLSDKPKLLLRTLLFAWGWFVLSMLPTYQVWNLTESLQCSRFIYAGSAPLSMLLALFLLVPLNPLTNKIVRRLISALATALAMAFVILYAQICLKNNTPWAHASSQVRDFRLAVERAFTSLKPGQKLAIINVPQKTEGAHMIYNGAMLSVLLSPPLSKTDMNAKVLSFEPPTYGDGELINSSRLRKLIQANQLFYRWDKQTHQLEPVKLLKSDLELIFKKEDLAFFGSKNFGNTARLLSPKLTLPATACDFIQCRFRFSSRSAKANTNIYLFWLGENNHSFSSSRCMVLPAILDGKEHDYFFPVSERKSWIAAGIIDRLCFELPFLSEESPRSMELLSVSLLNGKKLMPKLELKESQATLGSDGIYQINGKTINLECDGSALEACRSLVLEVSAPNSWFEHYSGSLRDRTLSAHAAKTYKAQSKKALFNLDKKNFPLPAFYQLRAAALDEQGKVTGWVSDPINIQVNPN
ncbi:MAG: glycosyltransferase family 39 protein [Candidatus Obscuribacterales bacterium]|nr:glycosyltransferase family 39 protein [Candidatus Obscuribacterales bacterium]